MIGITATSGSRLAPQSLAFAQQDIESLGLATWIQRLGMTRQWIKTFISDGGTGLSYSFLAELWIVDCDPTYLKSS